MSAESPAQDRPARILVVDDEEANRLLLERRLTAEGWQVTTVADGAAALTVLAATPVDLVLLDIMMPVLDGFDTLARLREQQPLTRLPVLIVTATDRSEDVIRALRLGANDYLVKPIDFELLLKRVRVHLSLTAPGAKRIGPYLISERIAEGGMGVLYAARHPTTGERVALKVLPRSLTIDDAYVERFTREAALATRVEHPSIVRVFEAGREDEVHYIVMEYAAGRNLRELCRDGPLPVPDALRIARQIAQGLRALHRAGIIHRDIKPENVVVNEALRAKITDFGIARELGKASYLTRSGVGIGSVLYSSPEQMQGEAGAPADVYGLGATLFFMLTGEDPFPIDKHPTWVLRAKQQGAPRVRQLRPEIPPVVDRLVAHLMAPRPARRPSDWMSIVDALEPQRPLALPGAPAAHPWLAPLVAALLALAALAAVVWSAWPR